VAHVEANEFLGAVKNRIPLQNRMLKSLAQSDSLVFGKLNLNMDVATHGLPPQFVDNLAGTISFSLTNGKLMESGLTQGFSSALSKVNSSLGFHQLTFGTLQGDLKVENGKLLVQDFHIDSSPVGSLLATGQVGFDNALNLQLTHALTPGMSKLVGGAASALTGQLAKWVPVPGLAHVSLIPMDKSGHALLYFTVGGILSRPAFSLDTKRMAKEGATGSGQSGLAQKKAEVKAKVETAVKAQVDSVKSQVKTQVKDAAKAKAKKVLKSFGF
jgi:AsmA-like C-terminal region